MAEAKKRLPTSHSARKHQRPGPQDRELARDELPRLLVGIGEFLAQLIAGGGDGLVLIFQLGELFFERLDLVGAVVRSRLRAAPNAK